MKTKTWLKGLVVAAVVSGGAAWAGESPWSLRLGVSYRDFNSVDFSGGGFRNLGTQTNLVGPYGVQNIMTAPGNPILAPVILDYVSGSSNSAGFNSADKMAPVVGFRYDLKPVGQLKLALVGNFQYYNLDVDASGGNLAVQQYQHFVLDAAGTLTPGAILVGPAFPGTTVSVRNRFDMDLYVLDFGLEGRLAVKSFNFTLAVGPSLTIANADLSQSQQASWIAQGPGLPAGGPQLRLLLPAPVPARVLPGPEEPAGV